MWRARSGDRHDQIQPTCSARRPTQSNALGATTGLPLHLVFEGKVAFVEADPCVCL